MVVGKEAKQRIKSNSAKKALARQGKIKQYLENTATLYFQAADTTDSKRKRSRKSNAT